MKQNTISACRQDRKILIINNYYRKSNLSGVDEIADALNKLRRSRYEIWHFSEIQKRKIPNNIEAIILSGSTAHIQNQNHLRMYNLESKLIKQIEVPVLGICFGLQIIGKAFGSQIEALPAVIRGFRKIRILEPNEIFSKWRKGTEIRLNQYHRDCLTNVPDDFILLAESESCRIEAIKHEEKPIYGIQAHIERVSDKNTDGWQVLENFFSNVVADDVGRNK